MRIFFFFTLGSPGSKMHYCWENSLTGTRRSVIQKYRGNFWEAILVLKFLSVATHFSPTIEDSILSVRSQPETFYVLKSSICKRRWYRVSRPNQRSLKILKIATTVDMLRFSNLFFSATTGLIQQFKSQLKDLFLLEEESKKSPCYWDFHQKFVRAKFPNGCF